MNCSFQCAGCGEWNQVLVDPSNGRRQMYVEDCQVCCRPNVLSISYNLSEDDWEIGSALESY
ncbi:MAG TPA: CPXCG motif-containing cysteine-rich protein [Terriglobales bacterium]